MKRQFHLVHPEARERALEAVRTAPDGFVVTVAEPTRTLEQNALMWSILDAIASKKQMCINGMMEWATAEDWKEVLTATYKREMRVALYDSRMILLGARTSKMGKRTFSDWLEFLNATAAAMGVDCAESK